MAQFALINFSSKFRSANEKFADTSETCPCCMTPFIDIFADDPVNFKMFANCEPTIEAGEKQRLRMFGHAVCQKCWPKNDRLDAKDPMKCKFCKLEDGGGRRSLVNPIKSQMQPLTSAMALVKQAHEHRLECKRIAEEEDQAQLERGDNLRHQAQADPERRRELQGERGHIQPQLAVPINQPIPGVATAAAVPMQPAPAPEPTVHAEPAAAPAPPRSRAGRKKATPEQADATAERKKQQDEYLDVCFDRNVLVLDDDGKAVVEKIRDTTTKEVVDCAFKEFTEGHIENIKEGCWWDPTETQNAPNGKPVPFSNTNMAYLFSSWLIDENEDLKLSRHKKTNEIEKQTNEIEKQTNEINKLKRKIAELEADKKETEDVLLEQNEAYDEVKRNLAEMASKHGKLARSNHFLRNKLKKYEANAEEVRELQSSLDL